MVDVENDPLGVLAAFNDVTPIESLPPQGVKEHRREIRYKASWKIAVTVEGKDLHDGRIKDISLHGAAILMGRNLKPNASVMLHIHIPSLAGPDVPKVLRVNGMTSYTVHDASDQCFRVGVYFVKFEMPSDCAYLEARLTNHHSKAL